MVIVITLAQVHISTEVSFSAGAPPIISVGEPGAHGVWVTGVHGIGVSTPRAAAVVAAMAGFAMDMHMLNGMMLTNGLLSMMLAAGTPLVMTLLIGSTTSALGARPKLHLSVALMHI